MTTTTTQIAIDDDALAAAAKVLGTTTKVSTVNGALRAVAMQHRQLEALDRAARDGTFDEMPSGDEAWR